jgi:hypothetical protein
MRSSLALVLVLANSALAAEPCETPRLHDTAPLATASAQDKVLATSFNKAATACVERGDACDQARVECGGLLTALLQKQTGFDEGIWLRDLLLPYLGQQYPITRTFAQITLAPDASCNIDVATLKDAAGRRTAQAARRDALLQEYQLYVKWAGGALQKCRERVAADDSKSAAAKAESERLAAAAGAIAATDLAKKQQEEAARKKAEEDAARLKNAQEVAARAQADAEARAAQERALAAAAVQKAQLDAAAANQKAILDAEQRNRQAQLDAEARARTDRAAEKKDAEAQAKQAEEERMLRERGTRVTQLKLQKEQMLADAELAYKRALAEEEQKKQAAVDAVAQNPAVAQAAVAQAAQATQARIDAEKSLELTRVKAERLEIDDSFERTRGHVALLAGGGAIGFGTAPVGAAGGMLTAHFGFWQQAPVSGMASGFELGLEARYFQGFGTAPTPREIEGHVTARYFIGPLGLGVVGEYRNFDAAFGVRPFGFGPAIGIALIDNPHTRAVFSVNWLPVGGVIDLVRLTGNFEVSYEWFTMRITGGTSTQAGVLGWEAAGFLGGRFHW